MCWQWIWTRKNSVSCYRIPVPPIFFSISVSFLSLFFLSQLLISMCILHQSAKSSWEVAQQFTIRAVCLFFIVTRHKRKWELVASQGQATWPLWNSHSCAPTCSITLKTGESNSSQSLLGYLEIIYYSLFEEKDFHQCSSLSSYPHLQSKST
jgi:hypothetical protein